MAKQRVHRKSRIALGLRHAQLRDMYEKNQEFYDDDEFDDGLCCTRCGGSGYMDADDSFWDDPDEFGQIDCWACSGTGEREHQTIF